MVTAIVGGFTAGPKGVGEGVAFGLGVTVGPIVALFALAAITDARTNCTCRSLCAGRSVDKCVDDWGTVVQVTCRNPDGISIETINVSERK